MLVRAVLLTMGFRPSVVQVPKYHSIFVANSNHLETPTLAEQIRTQTEQSVDMCPWPGHPQRHAETRENLSLETIRHC